MMRFTLSEYNKDNEQSGDNSEAKKMDESGGDAQMEASDSSKNTGDGAAEFPCAGCTFVGGNATALNKHVKDSHGFESAREMIAKAGDSPLKDLGAEHGAAAQLSTAGAKGGDEDGPSDVVMDAAAMLDGTEFDLSVFWEEQRQKSKKEGMAGADRIQLTRAILEAKAAIRAKKSEAEVIEVFRKLRTSDRWVEKPLQEAIDGYFRKYPGRDDKLRAMLTPERLQEQRDSMPTKNPAQVGFSVDESKKITIRFDDFKGVRTAREVAALLEADGLRFDPAKPAEDFIIFIDDDNTEIVKVTAQVLRNQRAVDLIAGASFELDGFPTNARVYSTQNVRAGKVLKLEGSICSHVKKLSALGFPLSRIMWFLTESLMALGMSPRSVYLDDEGAARRMVNVDTDDFGVRVEFFSAEDAAMAMRLFETTLSTWKATIHDSLSVNTALFKTTLVLKSFQVRKIQETHPNCILLKTNGAGMQFRQIVERKMGSASKASVAWYVENYIETMAPHLEIGYVVPETYPGNNNVNFNLGVRIYYGPSDAERKAMLAVYAAFTTRSEIHADMRLDFTREEGDPFNDMRCEVYHRGMQLRAYKECGAKDETGKQSELDKRSWLNDPIVYFQEMRRKNIATSIHEAQVRRQAALRAAGMDVPLPPIGSTAERIEQRQSAISDEERLREHLETARGQTLLGSKPIFPQFWRYAAPYVPPLERGGAQPNPVAGAVKWHDLLRKASPELFLTEEWEALTIGDDEARISESIELAIMDEIGKCPNKEGFIPAAAYNGIPIIASTVPKPEGDLADCDLRDRVVVGKWDELAAHIFKTVARLIAGGYLVQARRDSGICLSLGPRITYGNLTFDPAGAKTYLTGSGYGLRDQDAAVYAKVFAAKIRERGVLCVAASRYHNVRLPPYLVNLKADKEDAWTTHLRSHLELEYGHFTLIIQYMLSINPFTQVVSKRTGGIYILSSHEQGRRIEAGISDDDYKPVPWAERYENVRGRAARGRTPDSVAGASQILNTTAEDMHDDEKEAKKTAEARREKLVQQLRDSSIGPGLDDGFRDINHALTKGALMRVAGWQGCPPEIAKTLGEVAEELNPVEMTASLLRVICIDSTLQGTLTQKLAFAAEEEEEAETKDMLSQMASDLYRAGVVTEKMSELSSHAPEEMHATLARIPMVRGMFGRILSDLTDSLSNKGLSEKSLHQLKVLASEPQLLEMVKLEDSMSNDGRGGDDRLGGLSRIPESPEEGSQGGGEDIDLTQSEAGGGEGTMDTEQGGVEGGSILRDPAAPTSTATPAAGSIAPGSSTSGPTSRPLDPGIVSDLRQKLGTIAALPGMEGTVEPFMELARDLDGVFSIQLTIEKIVADVSNSAQIHAVIARASTTAELDMQVRLELAQIAIELHTFWCVHNEVVSRTFDPGLPAAGRELAVLFGGHPQLFSSICARLGIMAREGNLTDGQRKAMEELSIHPLLTKQSASDNGEEAGAGSDKNKTEQPAKSKKDNMGVKNQNNKPTGRGRGGGGGKKK